MIGLRYQKNIVIVAEVILQHFAGVVMVSKRSGIFYLFFLIFNHLTHPHGFGKDTLVCEGSNKSFLQLEHLVDLVGRHKKVHVFSFDEKDHTWAKNKVVAAGHSSVRYYCHLFFEQGQESLDCAFAQLFYRVDDQTWVPAYKVRAGDRLLCAQYASVEVAQVQLIEKPLDVYTLEIKNAHTFLVTSHKIVAHNMFLPLGAFIGISIPFDIGCGASAGIVFGPIGVCGGIIIGGLFACLVKICLEKRVVQYQIACQPNYRQLMNFNEQEGDAQEQKPGNGDGTQEKPEQGDEGKAPAKPDKGDDVKTPKKPVEGKGSKTVDDIINEAKPGEKTSGPSEQYVKPGGYPEAIEDFEDLGPTDIKKIPDKEVWVGTLPDGRKAVAREKSEDGRPTLEIQPKAGDYEKTKIRYGEK